MPLSLPPPELAGAGNRSGLISSADHAAILLPKSANFDDVILVSIASPSTCCGFTSDERTSANCTPNFVRQTITRQGNALFGDFFRVASIPGGQYRRMSSVLPGRQSPVQVGIMNRAFPALFAPALYGTMTLKFRKCRTRMESLKTNSVVERRSRQACVSDSPSSEETIPKGM
jgi:hypothetical protein